MCRIHVEGDVIINLAGGRRHVLLVRALFSTSSVADLFPLLDIPIGTVTQKESSLTACLRVEATEAKPIAGSIFSLEVFDVEPLKTRGLL